MRLMAREGIKWTPDPDMRDNRATNYDSKEDVEEAYQRELQKDLERRKPYIDEETGEEYDPTQDPEDFDGMTVEQRLALPDSYFIGDEPYWNHKGRMYTKIRVPSLKRSNKTWQRFYNEFPWLAAEVRLGRTRFINGAKLKYIW